MNGQLAEADVAYQGICARAKVSIFVIDDYIGIKSIMHFRNVNSNVVVTVFSDNKQNHLRLGDLNDFKNEFPSIRIDFKKTNNTMHDRYIILDYWKWSEKIYHCGASSKDAGKKTTTIMEVQDRTVHKRHYVYAHKWHFVYIHYLVDISSINHINQYFTSNFRCTTGMENTMNKEQEQQILDYYRTTDKLFTVRHTPMRIRLYLPKKTINTSGFYWSRKPVRS